MRKARAAIAPAAIESNSNQVEADENYGGDQWRQNEDNGYDKDTVQAGENGAQSRPENS